MKLNFSIAGGTPRFFTPDGFQLRYSACTLRHARQVWKWDIHFLGRLKV
jgi:hypothetical protein